MTHTAIWRIIVYRMHTSSCLGPYTYRASGKSQSRVGRIFVVIAAFLFLLFLSRGMTVQGDAAVRTIRTPHGAETPEALLDSKGILHLAYGLGNDAYYVQSRDGGRTFTNPVRLNQRVSTVTVGGERGPKLALGKDGMIHVVWLGHYQRGGGIWYTRSFNNGRAFEKERNLLDTQTGCDAATVVADTESNVLVFWLDGRWPPDPQSPIASPIFMSRSTDGGSTFSRNQPVRHDHPGRACACCRLEARVVEDGYLYLSFRGAYQNIRDIYLLKGRKTENSFKSIRVSMDQWKLDGCPMAGAHFSVGSTGRLLIAWRSRDKAFWSVLQKGWTNFSPRIGTPDGKGEEKYPLILVNQKNEVLFVWKRGPEVKWARYTMDGKFTGEGGIAGMLPGDRKPTGVVGWDGNFYVVL
ncbi:MAG: hypothetical protein HY644_01240 [Acidobacteria bacterium]|nr:hypothetical protein [Acidobacteriota bacterium]